MPGNTYPAVIIHIGRHDAPDSVGILFVNISDPIAHKETYVLFPQDDVHLLFILINFCRTGITLAGGSKFVEKIAK